MSKKRRAGNKEAGGKRLSFEELVEHLIRKCRDALEQKKLRASLADLIRIRAFREKIAPTERAKGEVEWIDGWD